MFQLYNTLSGRKEDFNPVEPNKVKMYVCGPTVYDYDHVGHARTYLSFDLLNRFLRFSGYQVEYIQNITDVGHLAGDAEVGRDKVQQKAQESGETVRQIVEHFTEAHLSDLKSLNILPPDQFPRASEHIGDIIKFIEQLVQKGFAYVTAQNNVYFSVAKDMDYGKLSHRGLTEVLTGTRVETASDKRSPADFALWKAAPVTTHDYIWDSPWGRGYPGWHIECSAMSRKYLGDTFDIHGSAVEHVFPHHENEIAQSESLTGKEMAHYWVHSGMLSVNGQKMSKSFHNGILVTDALKQYSANELRLAFYLTHYRKPFDYTKASMEQGVALRKKIFMAYAVAPENSDNKTFEEIISALNDDLDSPLALQIWGEHADALSKPEIEKLLDIFGLVYTPIEKNAEAMQLATDRDAARTRGDFLTADNRKAELLQHGYEVVDSDSGTQYIPR
ncbi:MAG TPA: cysteine--tRNA ligase [Candidatus Saccharimonadales bacterium]|nr:cysteine--tRNA ligase [Candidatus Saccharimonadales bacterium]